MSLGIVGFPNLYEMNNREFLSDLSSSTVTEPCTFNMLVPSLKCMEQDLGIGPDQPTLYSAVHVDKVTRRELSYRCAPDH